MDWRLLVVILLASLTKPANNLGEDRPGDRYVNYAINTALSEVGHAIDETILIVLRDQITSGASMSSTHIPKASALDISKSKEVLDRTYEIIEERLRKDNPSYLNVSKKTIKARADFVRNMVSRANIRAIWDQSGCAVTVRSVFCDDHCVHGPYRSMDGSCNNLEHPLWGTANTPFLRLVPADYEDGWNAPLDWSEKPHNGVKYPLAREVSLEVCSTPNLPNDKDYTYMIMLWGQFLDHDIDFTPGNPSKISFATGTACTKNCDHSHPCFPIHAAPDDPRIKKRPCLDFTRSAAVCTTTEKQPQDMKFEPREQFNVITTYIDASQVYGSSDEMAEELRELSTDDGLLRGGVLGKTGQPLLPYDESESDVSCLMDPKLKSGEKCFMAGDKRVNEHLGLTAIHTIWFREHNRIATALKNINPHWSGERIFQEARMIVGAEMQAITYKEYLPKVLGPMGMRQIGEYQGYDPKVNPTIANSFATATFRFGHAQVRPILSIRGDNFEYIGNATIPLDRAFFAPHLVRDIGIDPILRGFMYDPNKAITPDHLLSDMVTERLFLFTRDIALDLAALNIHRGRDHGLASYIDYRKYCNLPVANSWKDLAKEIRNSKVLEKLETLYGHPRNIDLFVGGLVEDTLPDSMVGPTFLCLLAEQFKRLRDGDRFFYEKPGVFTQAQLRELKKSTLARVLCDNGDAIHHSQPDVFTLPILKFPEERKDVTCTDDEQCFFRCDDDRKIPAINLDLWKDDNCVKAPAVKTFSEDFNPDFQTCCCGTLYGTRPMPFPSRNYHCCGDKIYDPLKDTCCNGVLNCGKTEVHHRCCGKIAFDPSVEVCRHDHIYEVGNHRFCGNELYIPGKMDLCCDGVLYHNHYEGATCCGKKQYDPRTQICCAGTVRDKVNEFCQCCGYEVYNPLKQICCLSQGTGVVHARASLLNSLSKDPQVCARGDNFKGVSYKPKVQSCCCGMIQSRVLSIPISCCDTKTFNINDQLCCAGNVVDGNPYTDACCGTNKYSWKTQSCCDIEGKLVVIKSKSCPVHNMGTCGHKDAYTQFNVETEVYCKDWLEPRGHVQDGGSNIRCCGGRTYNTTLYTCCPDYTCNGHKFDRWEIVAKRKCPKSFDPQRSVHSGGTCG